MSAFEFLMGFFMVIADCETQQGRPFSGALVVIWKLILLFYFFEVHVGHFVAFWLVVTGVGVALWLA
ncbi:MAG: hypothetical protein JXB49_22080, partial [Bacteroidales bacterium]|nr:hypothetical protein [Bacteroidales bacterium]